MLTEGDTLSEALAHVQDALAAVVEMYEDMGKPLPTLETPMDNLDVRLNALLASLKAMNDPVKTRGADGAPRRNLRRAEGHDGARPRRIPSLPELVRTLVALTAEVGHLRKRVGVLEAECFALRQRELLRFWEDEDAECAHHALNRDAMDP